MKKNIFKSFIFSLAVAALLTLFVFSGSAKEVKRNGFTFDVQKNGVTVVSYAGKEKKVRIPAKVGGVAVTKIGNECFWQIKTMTALSIPATVTEIGESAFVECTGLKRVILPKSLKSLGASAFWYCTNLQTVVFDSQAQKVGKDAFRGCDKVTVYAVSGTGAEKFLQKNKIKTGLTYPTKITVSKTSLRLNNGKTAALKITVSPEKTYYSAVTVSSANKNIAEVSQDGVVTAKGCGSTVITASVKGNDKISAKCKIAVVPPKPTELKQSEYTVSGATITWKKAAGATHYRVSRLDASKKKWVVLSTTNKTTYTFSNLKKGESFEVRVRSVFKSGKVRVLGGIASLTVSTRNNSPVENLRQTSKTIDSASISWKAPTGAVKFLVVLLDGNGKQLSRAYTTKTDFTFEDLSSTGKFKARVRAVFKTGSKTYLGNYKELELSTLKASKVSSLKVESVTDSDVLLSWNKVSGASRYYIYIYNTEKKTFVLSGSTEKTAFTVGNLDPEIEVRIKVCAAYLKTDGNYFIGQGSEIASKTKERPIPKTADEALSVFVKAFNATAGQKNFSVFETRTIKNGLALPSDEKFGKLLSSVDNEGSFDYNFKNGIESNKKLSLSQLFPAMNGKLSLSQTDAKNCLVDYRGDGNGYSLDVTLPSASKDNALLSSFTALPDWNALSSSNGVSFSTIEYGRAVVSAKVNGGKLDTLSVSIPFTAAGTDGKTVFTIGGTIEREYIFLWN